MSSRARVIISEPWEYETEVGSPHLTGTVLPPSDQTSGSLTIRLERPVKYAGAIFDGLVASARFAGDEDTLMRCEGKVTCSFLPVVLARTREDLGVSFLVGSVEFSD